MVSSPVVGNDRGREIEEKPSLLSVHIYSNPSRAIGMNEHYDVEVREQRVMLVVYKSGFDGGVFMMIR